MTFRTTKLVAALAIGSMCAGGAAAQFSGLGNAIKREANKKKNEAVREVVNQAEQSLEDAVRASQTRSPYTKTSGPVKMGTPSKQLTDLTNCAGIPLERVTIGTHGEYTFQQGFSKEKRDGFINRRPGKVIRDCITPSLQSGEIVYFEVDTAKYKAMTKGNDWQMQCVKSNNPGGGTISLNGWRGESEMWLGDKDMKLHCGNSEGDTDCATGTNAQRSRAYKNDLRARGKTGFSFLARTLDTGRDQDAGKLYCQFYNKRSGKSLVAFEMMFLKRSRR